MAKAKATTSKSSKTTAADSDITIWLPNKDAENGEELFAHLFQALTGANVKKSKAKERSSLFWQNSDSQINLQLSLKTHLEQQKFVFESIAKGNDISIVDDGYDEPLNWSPNFNTFASTPLLFTGNTGPTIATTEPYEIFTSIWDKNIMSFIIEETNRYARQVAELQKGAKISDQFVKVKWNDVTLDEMYVFFSLLIFESIQYNRNIATALGETLHVPFFPIIMTHDRFRMILSCLHFNDNTKLNDNDKKLSKIKAVLDHCNEKFSSMYQPRQFIDVDDSLLLSKDGTAEAIRYHASRHGMRTYELCEVFTGYMLKCLQYPGSDNGIDCKGKAAIVQDLVNEYRDQGHRVVTDRYFSSIYLAKALRSKGFDYIGEVRKPRKDLPEIIQELKKENGDLYKYKGNQMRVVTRHCGDVSVVAWSEWDVTAISTYHSSAMRPNKRGIRRPALTLDYLKVKEKISEKEKDLTEYSICNDDTERWYVDMFKRLYNISIRNSYIIYKSNKGNQCLTQLKFRYKLANQILDQHGVKETIAKARIVGMMKADSDSEDSDNWSDIESDDSNECSIM